MTVKITMTVNQSKFNETVDISAPQNAAPITDLFSGMGGAFGGLDELQGIEGLEELEDIGGAVGTATTMSGLST